MRWIVDLTNAINVRTIIISLILLIAAIVGINYFILHPLEITSQAINRNLNQMREDYAQLKSQDLAAICDTLNAEIKNLEQKEKKIFSSTLSNEEIPLFVSKLEREANSSGLKVNSSVVDTKTKKSGPFATISFDMKFTGSFHEVLNFLKRLESWNEVLLINDFRIKKKMLPTLNYLVKSKSLRWCHLSNRELSDEKIH